MPSDHILDKVKKLRELTGVGFKDCKNAIDESKGNIEKSIEFLRKKGIAKANKKMERVAADGLVCVCEKENKFSIIEINTETDFAAKNNEFIKKVKDNLVSLIAKIGEKITFRRCDFIGSGKFINFSYIHSSLKKNVGRIGVLLSLQTTKTKNELLELGKQLAMHIAASSPLAIDKKDLDQNILQKEKEIITEQLKNTGKDPKIIDKIAAGKLNKFISENTLLNQEWIMDPKKKVIDVLKEAANKGKIDIIKFVRFKAGEGI